MKRFMAWLRFHLGDWRELKRQWDYYASLPAPYQCAKGHDLAPDAAYCDVCHPDGWSPD